MTSKTLAGSLMTAGTSVYELRICCTRQLYSLKSAAAKGPAVTVYMQGDSMRFSPGIQSPSSWPNGRMAKPVFDPNTQCCGRPEPGNQSRWMRSYQKAQSLSPPPCCGKDQRMNIPSQFPAHTDMPARPMRSIAWAGTVIGEVRAAGMGPEDAHSLRRGTPGMCISNLFGEGMQMITGSTTYIANLIGHEDVADGAKGLDRESMRSTSANFSAVRSWFLIVLRCPHLDHSVK